MGSGVYNRTFALIPHFRQAVVSDERENRRTVHSRDEVYSGNFCVLQGGWTSYYARVSVAYRCKHTNTNTHTRCYNPRVRKFAIYQIIFQIRIFFIFETKTPSASGIQNGGWNTKWWLEYKMVARIQNGGQQKAKLSTTALSIFNPLCIWSWVP